MATRGREAIHGRRLGSHTVRVPQSGLA
jgi:hypothetical protein